MKKLILILALFQVILFSGCASCNISTRGGHTMVDIQNTCWHLFHCIPMAAGNPDSPNSISTRVFRSTVTLENNMNMLTRAMREQQAIGVKNITSSTTDESILFILLTRHACHTCAELVFPQKEPSCELQNP